MKRKILWWQKLFFMFCMISVASAETTAGDAARLVSVRPLAHPQELEVIIKVEGAFQHEFFELESPSRLVIDLTPVEETRVPAEIPVGAFGVDKIRTGTPKLKTVRIVFELSGRKSFYLVTKLSDGLQVIFFEAGSGQRTASPEKPAPAQPKTLQPPPAADVPRVSHPRRQTTLLGLGLGNLYLSDERFQRIFNRQTASCPVFDFSQAFLTTGPWSLAVASEFRIIVLEGQSTITLQKSETTLRPLDLGLRLILQQGTFWPYVSAGPVFFNYAERSTLQNTTGYTTGFSLQGGLYWGPSSLPVLKARTFIKWTKAVATENGLEVNLGGMEFGVGLSLAFSFF